MLSISYVYYWSENFLNLSEIQIHVLPLASWETNHQASQPTGEFNI